MAVYMLSRESICQSQVFATRSEDASPILRRKTLPDVDSPLKSEEGMDTSAFDRSGKMEDAVNCVAYIMSDCLDMITANCNVYLEGSDSSQLLQHVPKRVILQQLLQVCWTSW